MSSANIKIKQVKALKKNESTFKLSVFRFITGVYLEK